MAEINSLDTLEVLPSGAATGGEIKGLDLSKPVPAETQDALNKAWDDHLVLLFRDQELGQGDLVAASNIFGGCQIGGGRKFHVAGGAKAGDHSMANFDEVTLVSNLGPDDKPVMKNNGLGSMEVDWHTDNSYVATPPAGSFLYAVEAPVNGGGETSFNNQYDAWETLSEDLKEKVWGKVQKQDVSRNSAGVLRPSATLPKTPEEVEGPDHPLVRLHPRTQKPALYLGRRRIWPSNYIVGMDYDEGREVLAALWDHATDWDLAWTHEWKLGDAILWDNRVGMHHRKAIDLAQRRVMYRTQIKGEAIIPAWNKSERAA
jgi:taurine dioxygenase